MMDFWVSGHFPQGFTMEDWAKEIFKPVIETLDIPVFYKMLPSFDFDQIINLCKVLEKVGVAALQPTEGPVQPDAKFSELGGVSGWWLQFNLHNFLNTHSTISRPQKRTIRAAESHTVAARRPTTIV